MSTSLCLLLSIALLLLTSCPGDADKKRSLSEPTFRMRTLFILHRHGDRSPIRTYPKDPYGDPKYWPDGWGQLTIPGKRRLYKLGKFLRRRYANFLSDNPLEVRVRSSGANRCLNSVQCLLAGAYPPSGRYVIDPELKWQPFPVMTQPRIHDPMLNPASSCPAAERELAQIRNSPPVVAYREKSKQLLEYLTLNTGENVTDLTTAEYINDDLLVEQLTGYQVPAWANEKVLVELKALSDATFVFDGMTPRMQRFRSGVFLRDLKEQLKERSGLTDSSLRKGHVYKSTAEDDYPKKLHIYSTHDTMVSVVLQALGVFNNKAPPYAASIIFEHWQTTAGDNLIKFFYLNETEGDKLNPLLVRGCPESGNWCHVSHFLTAMKPLIVDDWNEECNSDDDNDNLIGKHCYAKPKPKHADVLMEPRINDPVDHERCSRKRSKSGH